MHIETSPQDTHPHCERCFDRVDRAQVELCEASNVPLICNRCAPTYGRGFTERVHLGRRSITPGMKQVTGVDWLRVVDMKLWSLKLERRERGSFVREMVRTTSYARLTDEEWTRVLGILDDLRLPVTIHNVSFGFNVGLTIYEPERPWLYPGVEEETRSEAITTIPAGGLPEELGDRIGFDDAWSVFEPLVFNDENLDRLRRCSIPAPKSKGSYAY